MAAIVGVNRSQTSRWVKGEERPGPAAAPLLIDLEHVLARARLVWGEEAARTWLESANVYLDGGRPIDVLQLSGPAPVLEALDAETWGGAA
ncbi:antitoxin Xre/MbcA/ParS toxin-binding domain-containing protein [Rhodococcus sp. C26F]